jgi:hypothetical protein
MLFITYFCFLGSICLVRTYKIVNVLANIVLKLVEILRDVV